MSSKPCSGSLKHTKHFFLSFRYLGIIRLCHSLPSSVLACHPCLWCTIHDPIDTPRSHRLFFLQNLSLLHHLRQYPEPLFLQYPQSNCRSFLLHVFSTCKLIHFNYVYLHYITSLLLDCHSFSQQGRQSSDVTFFPLNAESRCLPQFLQELSGRSIFPNYASP